jgi:hypothetical protein
MKKVTILVVNGDQMVLDPTGMSSPSVHSGHIPDYRWQHIIIYMDGEIR